MYVLAKPPDCKVPFTSVPAAVGVELGDPVAVGDPPQAVATRTATTANALRLDKLGKALLEFSQSDVHDLERQSEVRRDLVSLFRQARVGHLPQVHERFVVAEHHRLQLRVAVESQAADHSTIEVAHQPVSQK